MIAAAHQTMLAPQGAPLPYDAEVEYLESTGTQYIDTGVAPGDNELDFEIDFANESTSTSFQAAFGCRDNTNGAYVPESYAIFLRSTEPECRIDIANNGSSRTMSANVGTRYVFSWDSGNRILTKTVVSSGTTSTATANNKGVCEYTFALFGINTNGTISPGAAVRLYSAKFYKSGVLVRDYIPVRVGTVGYLFDRVSGELFGNAGTGAFTIGPDKT